MIISCKNQNINTQMHPLKSENGVSLNAANRKLYCSKIKIMFNSKKEVTQELSMIWKGNCPESLLEGKQIRMRLNSWDFYESEVTGLQIALLKGVQAIILNFRGKGAFRSTKEYGDDVYDMEYLSPQNISGFPFNDGIIFKTSEEVANYVKAIK